MTRHESERDSLLDVGAAKDFLTASHGTMARIMRALNSGSKARSESIDNERVWIFGSQSADDEVTVSQLRVVTISHGDLMRREIFRTEKSPVSARLSHEVFVSDGRTGSMVSAKRTILWLQGIEITTPNSIPDIEESVAKLNTVNKALTQK